MIEELPALTPDPERSRRTLRMCRERLSPKAAAPTALDGAFAAVCLVYLAAMALDVARIMIR